MRPRTHLSLKNSIDPTCHCNKDESLSRAPQLENRWLRRKCRLIMEL